ncbi:hypothetical protein V8E54_004327 [Elaphomyces granulatus]|jgi:glycine/D-amino acid oxidase-like deaminating enzyme
MTINRIVVLGAGVSGLTTAYQLSKNASNQITVAAKHMPGDYDIEYCSPWAGANYFPVGAFDSDNGKWEKDTWPMLRELAQNIPEAGIHFQDYVVYIRKKDEQRVAGQRSAGSMKDPWFKNMLPNFRQVPKDQLAPGIDSAYHFTSLCINPAIYLPWLVGQCRKNGVVFKRAVVKHVVDAAYAHHGGKADLVVNCTGLSSRSLGGVTDSSLCPARGQTVVVRNDPGFMCMTSGCDDGDDEVVYMMTRAAGGGTILGGSYQKHNWDPLPDPSLAIRIMKRCVEVCPSLVAEGKGIEGLDIIRHGVGLRPLRENGPRVERENINGVWVVHNYGHGGFGYQASYGCAATAVKLVDEALQQKDKAKL